jgi:hypothetical protein
MAVLSRNQMEQVIRNGGSVLVGGRIITKAEHLPTDADLAKGNPEQEQQVLATLQEQIAALQRQQDELTKRQAAAAKAAKGAASGSQGQQQPPSGGAQDPKGDDK